MNQTIIFGIGIALMLGIGIGIVALAQNPSPDGLSNAPLENARTISLGFRNGNYFPNTIELREGEPVRITLDGSVQGCYRDFTIRSLGIHEYLRTPSDSVEFIAPARGTYGFSCSMGMGTGTIVVR